MHGLSLASGSTLVLGGLKDHRPLGWSKISRSSVSVRALRVVSASCGPTDARTGEVSLHRRQLLATVVATSALAFSDVALAEKPPKGFSVNSDSIDKYAFLYPFGWQEVAVKGQDVVYKDVIEPLESVSVSIIKTDKTDLTELGSPEQVAEALVTRVLTSPTQISKVLSATERESDGKKYYSFEFTASASNFKRHGLGTVAIGNGKFYTITTGSNERRWEKMEEKLRAIVNSFVLL